jgi:hypothetical protein
MVKKREKKYKRTGTTCASAGCVEKSGNMMGKLAKKWAKNGIKWVKFREF